MIKNNIAKLLTTAALLSSFTFSTHAAPSISDIEGSYAKDAIQNLVEAGIINGKGDGKFDPTGKITRQDFAIILAKSLNLDISNAPATATFSDVPTTHYSYQYIEAAAKAGLIAGQGNGQFGNGQNLSRQDMAVLFVRALGVDVTGKAIDLKFSDAGSIADYAKDAVAAAVELGLLAGNGDGSFNPTGNAERQAVAQVASKFLTVAETIKSNPPQPTTPDLPSPVPTPTLTPSPTPSVSGSSGGGGSNRDRTAPTVTVISRSPVDIGNDVIFTSNETGTIYLVPFSENPRNREELEGLISENRAKKASVIAINTNTNITTAGLQAGSYKIYAMDARENISVPTSEIELRIPQNQSPVVIADLKLTVTDSVYTMDIGHVFEESLELTVESSDPRVAEVDIEGNTLLIFPGIVIGNTIITISANGGQGGPVSESFTVTIIANRNELNALIQEVTALKDEAQVGTTPDTYPQEAYDAFVEAIASATEVHSNQGSTQQQVDDAVTALHQAIETFYTSIQYLD